MGFGNWRQVFGDPSMTAALMDQITHKAHAINCKWESYCLKEILKSNQGRQSHANCDIQFF
jgi:DNA replication protein DnaC